MRASLAAPTATGERLCYRFGPTDLRRQHWRAIVRPCSRHGHREGVGLEDNVRMQQGQKGLEITLARGRKEGINDLAMTRSGSFRNLGVMHSTPGSAGELAGGGRGTLQDGGNLVERDGEHVVQHEGDAFCRIKLVEHDEHGEADGLCEDRFLLRTGFVVRSGFIAG